MRRRPHADPPVNQERWLVSYADFITLLFAFFTTLYAISVIDAEKAERLVHSIRNSFGDEILEQGSAVPGFFDRQPDAPIPLGESAGTGNPSEIDRQRLDLLGRRVRDSEETARLGDRVHVSQGEEGLVIHLSDQLFFGSGGSLPSEEARGALKGIARLLQDVPNHVRVEGHTDNRPLKRGSVKSNWHLSVLRAVEVLRVLEQDGVPAFRLSAAGFADQRPLASNATAEGRSANRRVDIVVLRAPR